jgi:hypothetical protein
LSHEGFHDGHNTRVHRGRGRGGPRGGYNSRGGNNYNNSHNQHHQRERTGYSPPVYTENFYEKKSESSFKDHDSAYGRDVDLKRGDRVPETLDPEMREVFPFRIFIKDDYLKEGLASRNETDEIIRQAGIKCITMDNQI